MVLTKYQASTVAELIDQHRQDADVELQSMPNGTVIISMSLTRGPWFHIDEVGGSTPMEGHDFHYLKENK